MQLRFPDSANCCDRGACSQGDLLNMDLLDASNGDAAPPSSAAATDLLADLLGGGPTPPPPPSDTAGQSAPPHNTADALAELLGGVPSSTPVAPANPLANIMVGPRFRH